MHIHIHTHSNSYTEQYRRNVCNPLGDVKRGIDWEAWEAVVRERFVLYSV